MEARDKKVLIQSVSAVLIIVVLFNVYSGVTVSKIGIPGLIDIEFNPNNGTATATGSADDRQDPALTRSTNTIDRNGVNSGPSIIDDQNIRDVSNDIERQPLEDIYHPVQPETTPPPVIDLNGTWYGADGSEYEITHDGNTVYFTEYGLFGATANGMGTYQNNAVSFGYETVYGTVGTATLNLSSNGQILSGRAFDKVAGTSTDLYLTRY